MRCKKFFKPLIGLVCFGLLLSITPNRKDDSPAPGMPTFLKAQVDAENRLNDYFDFNRPVPTIDSSELQTFQSDNNIDSYLDSEAYQYSFVSVAHEVIADLSKEEFMAFQRLAQDDSDIALLYDLAIAKTAVEDLIAQDKENENDSIGVQSIAALGALLATAGLGQTVINIITGAFATVAASSWLPFVGWGICAAAVLVLTVTIVVNWDKIEPIIWKVIDFFIGVARGLANGIRDLFNTICGKAADSVIALKVWDSGQLINFRHLTVAYVKTLAGKMSHDQYLLVANKFDGEWLCVSLKPYTKKAIIPYYHKNFSSYTLRSNDAYSSMRDASHVGEVLHAEYHMNDKHNVAFMHYHNKDAFPPKKGWRVHSFYGSPIYG